MEFFFNQLFKKVVFKPRRVAVGLELCKFRLDHIKYTGVLLLKTACVIKCHDRNNRQSFIDFGLFASSDRFPTKNRCFQNRPLSGQERTTIVGGGKRGRKTGRGRQRGPICCRKEKERWQLDFPAFAPLFVPETAIVHSSPSDADGSVVLPRSNGGNSAGMDGMCA